MEQIQLPKSLYKYRSISDKILYERDENGNHKFVDNGLDALSRGEIWFSHLDKLNDPYENLYAFDYSSFFNNLETYLSTYPKPQIADLPKKMYLETMIANMKKEGCSDADIINSLDATRTPSLRRELKGLISRIEQDKKNKTGILSLCGTNDNLLMWAYYAKEHNGYCLEFSTSEDHKGQNILKDEKFTYRVTYGKKILSLEDVNPFYSSATVNQTRDMDDMVNAIQKIYCHKSQEWEREDEWRVIADVSQSKKTPDAPGALMPFPGKLTAVYFGCRTNQICIDAVKEAVQIGNYGYTTEFKKAKLKSDSFGLDFNPV